MKNVRLAPAPPPVDPEAPASARLEADRHLAQRAWIATLSGAGSDMPLSTLTEAQWVLFVEEARRHQLSGLTYRTLQEQQKDGGAPQHVLDGLRPAYLDTALRNAVFFRYTARMAALLAGRGIPVMLLKGMHLARYTYAESAMRSMADVDIMVPRAGLAEAEQVFLEQGYGPTPRPDLDQFCSWSNHLAKLSMPMAPVFEIHWAIERPTSPFRIDLDGLWSRSRAEELDDVPIRVLALEDLLLHLALHSSYHHRFDRSAFKGLVDIHAVIVRHREEIQWRALADRAVEWGASGFLYATLRLGTQVLNTPVPPDMLASLPHGREDEDVVDVARRYILVPVPKLPESYLKLAQSRGLRARSRVLLHRVFLPRNVMERIYRLEPGSRRIWPYYVHRLGGLLLSRSALLLRALMRTRTTHAAIDREEQRLWIQGWTEVSPGTAGPRHRSG